MECKSSPEARNCFAIPERSWATNMKVLGIWLGQIRQYYALSCQTIFKTLEFRATNFSRILQQLKKSVHMLLGSFTKYMIRISWGWGGSGLWTKTFKGIWTMNQGILNWLKQSGYYKDIILWMKIQKWMGFRICLYDICTALYQS